VPRGGGHQAQGERHAVHDVAPGEDADELHRDESATTLELNDLGRVRMELSSTCPKAHSPAASRSSDRAAWPPSLAWHSWF
jgi:hypothetical protein